MRRGNVVAALLAVGSLLLTGAPAGAIVENPHNVEACTRCHGGTPQFGVDSLQTVTFTTSADDPGLCAPCHEPASTLHPVGIDARSGPSGARVSAYLPAGAGGALAGKIVCTTCHFVHAADGRHALLRGFPGSPDPQHFPAWGDFCRECHGWNLSGRAAHDGGAEACRFCHLERPRDGRKPELLTGGRDLCAFCHVDTPEAHYRDANPLGTVRYCTDCHDEHAEAAERPGLLREEFLASALADPRVRPHYRRGLCLACHDNLDDFELRGDGINATCDRCHASGKIRANIHPLRVVPTSIKPPEDWPLVAGALTCLTCHEQGHEDQDPLPYMLRGGPYAGAREVCRRCHGGPDQIDSTIHRDINEGRRCDFCHKGTPVSGRDRAADVSFIAAPDLLCMRCHDIEATPSDHHRYFKRGGLAVDQMPDFLPLYEGRITCATCHNPHQLEADNHRLRGGIGESELCLGCHSQ